ncbi:MAG: DUF2079 domain-containing protein, partial [Marmoricola sp.]
WYQYDAVLVPIAVAAMIEGGRLLHGRIPDPLRVAALATAVIGTLVLVPQQALAQVWKPDFWRTPPVVAEVDQALDLIPTDSRVAASDNLGPRIALRTELYLVGDTIAPAGPPLPPSEFDEVEWVAFDRLFPLSQTPAWLGFSQLLDAGEFDVVAEVGGVIVAKRREG